MKVSLVIFLALLISACDNQEKSQEKSQDQKVSEPLTQAVEEKEVAEMEMDEQITVASESMPVDFTYNDLNGNKVNLSDFRGKWVVVNFWATWCPPCRKEIPDFVKFKSLYSNNVEILGIDNEDAEIETIKKFAEDFSINYPILMADVYNPTEFDRENTMGLPTTVIFDPQGIQVSKRVGPIHYKDLLEIIDVEPNDPSTIEEATKEAE